MTWKNETYHKGFPLYVLRDAGGVELARTQKAAPWTDKPWFAWLPDDTDPGRYRTLAEAKAACKDQLQSITERT